MERPVVERLGQGKHARRLDAPSLDQSRHWMDFLAEGFRRAWGLLVAGDSEVYGIALLTLKVAASGNTHSCSRGATPPYMPPPPPGWCCRPAPSHAHNGP